jgi:hypothetical protein
MIPGPGAHLVMPDYAAPATMGLVWFTQAPPSLLRIRPIPPHLPSAFPPLRHAIRCVASHGTTALLCGRTGGCSTSSHGETCLARTHARAARQTVMRVYSP